MTKGCHGPLCDALGIAGMSIHGTREIEEAGSIVHAAVTAPDRVEPANQLMRQAGS